MEQGRHDLQERSFMNQTEQVLFYMKENGSITPMEALENFGIMRLGARIFDLKSCGISIKTLQETKKNRYGKPVHYARYVLEDYDA